MSPTTFGSEKTLHRHPPEKQSYVFVILISMAAFLAAFPLLSLPPLTNALAEHLSLHILFDSISVVIALLVFAIGWSSYGHHLPENIIVLAIVFLGVGILDFAHILSFTGIPDFITPGSDEKSIHFWLAARLLAAVALLLYAILPWRPFASTAIHYLLLAAVLIFVTFLHWLFLLHPEILPAPVTPVKDLFPFEIDTEYAIIALNLTAALILWLYRRRDRPFNTELFAAACIMAMSEFYFTLDSDVTDIYNLLGHIYKIAAYLFIYRAIFVTAVRKPYLELNASQNHLQATIHAIPDLLFEVGLDGRYYDYHTPDHGPSTLPQKRLIGKTMQEMLPPDVAALGLAALQEAADTGSSRGEYILDLPTGRHWFEFSISKKASEAGKEPHFIVLSRDVSDRKRAEIDQRESQKLLENIINNLPQVIFLKRASDLRYTLLNRTGEEMIGYKHDEIIGRNDYDLFPKEQAAFFTAKDQATLAHGGITDIPEEFVQTPDGIRMVHTTKLVLNDEQSEPQYIMGISEDITERRQIELELLESEKFLRETQSIADIGSYDLNMHTGRWKSSDILDRIFGIDEAYDRTLKGWLSLIHPDERALVEGYFLRDVLATCSTFNKEYRIIRQNDRAERWVHCLGKVTCDSQNRPLKMQGTIQDITQRKEAQETLVKLSLAVEQSPNSIMITDTAANIEYVNTTFCQVTGYRPEEVIGKNPSIISSGKVDQEIYDAMWKQLLRGETWYGELINRRKDGTEYIESAVISPVRQADGRITHYLAIKEDITEKKKSEARIENLAHFDQLTGLPNRATLNDRIDYLLKLAKRNKKPLTVMFLDLDHFKNINDTLGHSIGDALLKYTSKRLITTVRKEDTVSRLGGDEFILILPDTDANGAIHVATKLIEAISVPFHIEHHELVVTPSIGIAIYPEDGEDFETLSKNADTAMYQVKQENRNNFRFFTQEMQIHSVRNLKLGNALRLALSRNELQVHYQPQIAMEDGRVIGAEALLRWHHPDLGIISPAEFIPIAEDNGQIIQIGEWVLRTAVRQAKEWMESGLPPMVVAVNLSAVQFHQPGLPELVTHILDEAGLPHEYLELELTEAVAMKNPQIAIAIMDELFAQGIRMSIDDFGTGYSSLSYLKRFKVYKLKIDQSFVRDVPHDTEDNAIVSTIITMATELGMHTIAEGVETSEQLAFLRLKGCSEIQGYYFSKPLPAEAFSAYVKRSGHLAP